MIRQSIPEWLALIRAWLRRRLARTPKPLAARPRSNIAKTVVINREEEGAFFYLRDVLDRLGQCQKLLKALRRAHPDAYAYHSRVGAKVIPERSLIKIQSLWPEFLKARPALGMSLFFQKKGSEYLPIMLYFDKVKHPVYVESSRFDIYECIAMFFYKKRACAVNFYIAIDDSGAGHLLREKGDISQKLPRGETLKRRGWCYPRMLQLFYKDRSSEYETMTLEQYSFGWFCAAANYSMMPASDELLIRCSRGGITTAMNVSTKRTPYFFSDRETTLAIDGKRKRIFHIVRTHIRVLSGGRISEVSEHYRGERTFTWGGYQVVISAPKNQFMVEHPIAGTIYDDDEAIPPGTIGSADLGDKIVTLLEDSR